MPEMFEKNLNLTSKKKIATDEGKMYAISKLLFFCFFLAFYFFINWQGGGVFVLGCLKSFAPRYKHDSSLFDLFA